MIFPVLLSVFILSTVICTAGILVLYLYVKDKYKYWSKRNVPHAKPVFPVGNLIGLKDYNINTVFQRIYEEGRDHRFYGIWQFHRPALVISDPELIKKIMVADFMSFHDHGNYYNEKDDPLSANLFSLEGAAWRNLRVKLTPVFTSGKMKMMFPCMVECGKELQEVLMEHAKIGDVIDVKEFSARYSTDIISSVAFGIEAHSLNNPNAVVRQMGRKIFAPTWGIMLRNFASFFVPDLAKLLKVTVTPTDVSDFFLKTFREVVDYREKSNTRRNDAMQLLIDLYKKGYIEDVDNPKKEEVDKKDPFTFEQLAAQAFIFFVGGFETSATTMQFLLYELAKNQDLQNKARDEIKRVLAKHKGQVTYEAVYEMELLGRIMDETLRKYSPAGVVSRACSRDYQIPDSDVTIEKGIQVIIPVFGLHHDEKYFPSPEKFDPDRFTEEGKASRPNYTYLPFGDGPRLCIGQRFGQMQTRVGVVSFLTKFKLDISEKHTPKEPMEFDPKSFIISPKGAMKLKISLLDG